MTPKKIAFVYVILVVVICFSLLYGWVPVLHKQAYIGIAAILASLLISPRYFRTPLFFIAAFYALVVWINYQWGDEYTSDKSIMDGIMLLMSGSISYYLIKSDDKKIKKWISISIMIIIIIQTIPAIFLYFTSGDTIRNFIGLISQDQSEYEWDQLFRMGIMAYPMTHSLPVLVPPLMMWIRTKGINKSWKSLCFITLICILLLTFIYDVTTVQFLVLFCMAASLFITPDNMKKNRQRVILAAVILLPFVMSTTVQELTLKGVESVAPGEMKIKVADMRYNLTHDDDTGDMGMRSQYYSMSLESFMWSPVIGTDDNSRIGGHSSILDRMAAFGLLGFVPYLLILVITTRFCRQSMPHSYRWYYTIATISFVALLLLKNMSYIEEWVMYLVVAPSLLTLNDGIEKRKVLNRNQIKTVE